MRDFMNILREDFDTDQVAADDERASAEYAREKKIVANIEKVCKLIGLDHAGVKTFEGEVSINVEGPVSYAQMRGLTAYVGNDVKVLANESGYGVGVQFPDTKLNPRDSVFYKT